MHLPFLRLPRRSKPDVYSFCEPVWASTLSVVHIRLLNSGRKLGGGIDGTTLCGRDISGGWDLAAEVEEMLVRRDLDLQRRSYAQDYANPLCRDCAMVWLALP